MKAGGGCPKEERPPPPGAPGGPAKRDALGGWTGGLDGLLFPPINEENSMPLSWRATGSYLGLFDGGLSSD